MTKHRNKNTHTQKACTTKLKNGQNIETVKDMHQQKAQGKHKKEHALIKNIRKPQNKKTCTNKKHKNNIEKHTLTKITRYTPKNKFKHAPAKKHQNSIEKTKKNMHRQQKTPEKTQKKNHAPTKTPK